MDDDSDRSSEATQFEILTRKPYGDNNNNDDDGEHSSGTVNEEFDDDDDATDDQREEVSDFETSRMEIERSCGEETLGSGLAEVPVQYEVRHEELQQLKNQLQGSHQEALAVVIAQAAQAHSGNNQSLTSDFPTPISTIARLNSKVDTPSTESNQRINSDSKTVSTSRTVKTPIDGYNWRKYGQKQVKSPPGSRSYFKCTYNECDAKKIESCDQHNSVTKIVYKGQHKHEPPKKVYSRRGKVVSGSSRGKERKSISEPPSKQHISSGSISNGLILVEEMDAPPPKPRVKKSSSASPGSVLKPPKKPKFVIHAASDVGISADGYRWRKYGQKMVKGNPHPRNYYKCTSAGCPVRKHIEMAVDGSSEVILTYKGIHDHDIPAPTKVQAPPTVLLLNAVSSPSKNDNSQSSKGETDPSNSVPDNKIKA
ncbi:putative transcription factor WRKY family [Helianthus annuus]|nr:putative transcription factor WRKY family [Helianthus annuus]KAJ0772745.1 putative transcription factor WRKY family [Helianthus annuus]KAJ0934191.1 putative transcription factor WRKY family [Helianthus annuus]KAJ0942271.1 putative transcription factor WRKY family [Helianthus annuus]